MILTNVKTTVDNLTLLSDGKPTFRLLDFTYSSVWFFPPLKATNKLDHSKPNILTIKPSIPLLLLYRCGLSTTLYEFQRT